MSYPVGQRSRARNDHWRSPLRSLHVTPMIIDAMDLLHTSNFNGFFLVSSDSDFTRLASRIRESGLLVYGFGENKTPSAFVPACDKFIYTEVLRAETNENSARCSYQHWVKCFFTCGHTASGIPSRPAACQAAVAGPHVTHSTHC